MTWLVPKPEISSRQIESGKEKITPVVSKDYWRQQGFNFEHGATHGSQQTRQSCNLPKHKLHPMKQIITTSLLAAICVFSSGCASIVDGRAKTVRINSDPPGAKISVFDKNGQAITNLITPASIRLKRHGGYFSGEKYKVVFENPGYYPTEIYIQSKLNGWYFGNFVFGGLIGFLIVDPATGAMWTLSPREVNWKLVSSSVSLTPDQLKEAELKANPPKQKPKPAPTGKGSVQ